MCPGEGNGTRECACELVWLSPCLGSMVCFYFNSGPRRACEGACVWSRMRCRLRVHARPWVGCLVWWGVKAVLNRVRVNCCCCWSSRRLVHGLLEWIADTVIDHAVFVLYRGWSSHHCRGAHLPIFKNLRASWVVSMVWILDGPRRMFKILSDKIALLRVRGMHEATKEGKLEFKRGCCLCRLVYKSMTQCAVESVWRF